MAPRTESSTVLHTAPGWVGELVDAPGEEEQPALAQLPILDLGDWRAGSERRDAFVAGLRTACTHPQSGFFYLRVGGADEEGWAADAAAALQLTTDFFALPLEDKLAIDLQQSPHYRGFAALGTETTGGVTDLREYVELGEEREALDSGPLAARSYVRMGIGPNQWPAEPPQFASALSAYFERCRGVAADVMGGVSAALALPPDELAQRFCPAPLGAHARYKPACYRSAAEAEDAGVGDLMAPESKGLGAHKDFGFLSLLLQNEVGGLEVQRASDGIWLQAPPIDGTLVVNLGEMAELVSGGAFVASTHRVLPPPGDVPRVSIPVFYNPSLDSVVDAVELTPELQALADARRRAGITMDGTDDNRVEKVYGENWVKGFARSQPRWFKQHLPDVFEREAALQRTSIRPNGASAISRL
jgi:isopenicillin N synthase-like dioxygenase